MQYTADYFAKSLYWTKPLTKGIHIMHWSRAPAAPFEPIQHRITAEWEFYENSIKQRSVYVRGPKGTEYWLRRDAKSLWKWGRFEWPE